MLDHLEFAWIREVFFTGNKKQARSAMDAVIVNWEMYIKDKNHREYIGQSMG